MEKLVQEFKRGSKIYIGEAISLIGLLVFFMMMPRIPFLLESNLGGIMIIGWFIINALVMMIYSIYDFVTIMLSEQKIDDISQGILFKILFFGLFFGINMFLFIISSSIAVPILALLGTFYVLAMTKEYFNKKVPYVCLGVLWYATLFVIAYFGHKVIYILLYQIIRNTTIIGIVTTALFLALAFLIFILLMKKIKN